MSKYKCCECGEIFDENRAGIRSELIDHFAGYGNYYEHYYVCPECGSDWVESYNEKQEPCISCDHYKDYKCGNINTVKCCKCDKCQFEPKSKE